MELFLIRHGQTNWNKEKKIQGSIDISLNDVGIKEATDRADYFFKNNIIPDAIYCSNKKRAIESATLIAKKFSLKPIVIENLEEMNLGLWEGKTWKEVQRQYPKELSIFESKDCKYFSSHNGESYVDVAYRVIKELKNICNKEKNKKNIFVVTHGAVIMTIRLFLEDKNWQKKNINLIPKNLEFVKINEKEILDYEF